MADQPVSFLCGTRERTGHRGAGRVRTYVTDLEEVWDGSDPIDDTDTDTDLSDDPETLLAEVEQFLRDND